MNDVDELLSIKQAAKLLSVSADTIRRQIRNNKLKAVLKNGPHGKYYCIPRSGLKVATEVKDVISFNRAITPRELIDKTNEALAIRLAERDGVTLQKFNEIDEKLQRIDELNKKLTLILNKFPTSQTASSDQHKRDLVARLLRRNKIPS